MVNFSINSISKQLSHNSYLKVQYYYNIIITYLIILLYVIEGTIALLKFKFQAHFLTFPPIVQAAMSSPDRH